LLVSPPQLAHQLLCNAGPMVIHVDNGWSIICTDAGCSLWHHHSLAFLASHQGGVHGVLDPRTAPWQGCTTACCPARRARSQPSSGDLMPHGVLRARKLSCRAGASIWNSMTVSCVPPRLRLKGMVSNRKDSIYRSGAKFPTRSSPAAPCPASVVTTFGSSYVSFPSVLPFRFTR
jgi:hypothetical protein